MLRSDNAKELSHHSDGWESYFPYMWVQNPAGLAPATKLTFSNEIAATKKRLKDAADASNGILGSSSNCSKSLQKAQAQVSQQQSSEVPMVGRSQPLLSQSTPDSRLPPCNQHLQHFHARKLFALKTSSIASTTGKVHRSKKDVQSPAALTSKAKIAKNHTESNQHRLIFGESFLKPSKRL